MGRNITARQKSYDPPDWICHYHAECKKAKACHHGESHYCGDAAEKCYDYNPGGIIAFCEKKEVQDAETK